MEREQLASVRAWADEIRRKIKTGDGDDTYLVKNGLPAYLLELKAAKIAFCRKCIRKYLESNTYLSLGMLKLAILLR